MTDEKKPYNAQPTLAVRMPPKEKAAIRAAAKADGRSITSWVRRELADAVARQAKDTA